MKKEDLKNLIETRREDLKGTRKSDPDNITLHQSLQKCIKDAENILSDIKGELTSSQLEVYNNLMYAI